MFSYRRRYIVFNLVFFVPVVLGVIRWSSFEKEKFLGLFYFKLNFELIKLGVLDGGILI